MEQGIEGESCIPCAGGVQRVGGPCANTTRRPIWVANMLPINIDFVELLRTKWGCPYIFSRLYKAWLSRATYGFMAR